MGQPKQTARKPSGGRCPLEQQARRDAGEATTPSLPGVHLSSLAGALLAQAEAAAAKAPHVRVVRAVADAAFVVVADVRAPVYDEALNTRKPVVTPAWLEQCASTGRVPSTAPFTVKAFTGLEVVVTGLEVPQRRRVEALVAEHGGVYSSQLERGKSTHLIAEKTDTPKFQRAVEWGVTVVRMAWLDACVRSGAYVHETPYVLGGSGAGTATTTTTTAGLGAAGPHVAAVEVPASLQRRIEPATVTESFVPATEAPSAATAVDPVVRAAEEWSANHFARCRVLMCGYGPPGRSPEGRALHIALCRGQATIIGEEELESATHIVLTDSATVSNELGRRMMSITTRGCNPAYVVLPAWVKACDEAKKCLPPFAYQVVSHRYQPVENTKRPPRKSLPAAGSAGAPVDAAAAADAGLPGMTPPKVLLAGRGVALSFSLAEEEAERAKRLISELGGEHVQEARRAAYLVCPAQMSTRLLAEAPRDAPTATLASLFWLESCAKHGVLFDVEETIAFQPNPCGSLKEMDGCMICCSQYEAHLRDAIKQLATMLGASYNDKLYKAKSTHLIVPVPEGQKYEMALKWGGIHAVSIRWLEESARRGRREPEEAHRIADGRAPALAWTAPAADGTQVPTSAPQLPAKQSQLPLGPSTTGAANRRASAGEASGRQPSVTKAHSTRAPRKRPSGGLQQPQPQAKRPSLSPAGRAGPLALHASSPPAQVSLPSPPAATRPSQAAVQPSNLPSDGAAAEPPRPTDPAPPQPPAPPPPAPPPPEPAAVEPAPEKRGRLADLIENVALCADKAGSGGRFDIDGGSEPMDTVGDIGVLGAEGALPPPISRRTHDPPNRRRLRSTFPRPAEEPSTLNCSQMPEMSQQVGYGRGASTALPQLPRGGGSAGSSALNSLLGVGSAKKQAQPQNNKAMESDWRAAANVLT